MTNRYRFGSPVYYLRQRHFFRRRRRFILWLIIVLIAAGLIAYDLWRSNRHPAQPVSKAVTSQIGAEKVYKTAYFQFSDPTDEWVIDSADTKGNVYVFLRYHKKELQHLLTVYVNQEPIPLNLAVGRVLPVTVNNGNKLQATSVSDLCGHAYAPNEPLRIHNINIGGATMLCQPDAAAYTVVLARIGGDYNIDLTRQDGTSARYVILYQDLMFTPTAAVIQHIGNTFQAL